MTADGRHGKFETQPDGTRTLRFRRSWAQPVEEVWSALTEPERLARWIGTYDGERQAGGTGTFTMTQEDEPVGEAMSILACDPAQRLAVSWTGQEHWEVTLDLSTEGGRTVLLFAQAFRSGEDVGDIATGWHWYLDKLEAEVTGTSQPADWDAFLAQVGPAYGQPAKP